MYIEAHVSNYQCLLLFKLKLANKNIKFIHLVISEDFAVSLSKNRCVHRDHAVVS